MRVPGFPSPLAWFLLLLAASPAAAQVPLPQGGAPVVIGRVFHRDSAGTRPVGRFGLVVPKDGEGRARVEVPLVAGDPASGYELLISARGRRGAVELSWELHPLAGSSAPGGEGRAEVRAGQLGHVDLGGVGDTRLHASVEHGRASSFDALKLARHFGIALQGAPAPMAPAPRAPLAPAAPAPVRAQPVAPRPAPVVDSTLDLSFRLEQDGEAVFAPRVRVRSGEPFEVRSGRTFEAEGGRWDGFELGGTARQVANGCLIDLAAQFGRRLEGEGAATWLVDRYRRDVAVPLGREASVELFDELEGADAGRLRLFVTCRPE